MTDEQRQYGRQTTVLACFGAWIIGIATGAALVHGYAARGAEADRRHEEEADRRYASIALPPRPPVVTQPAAPTPRPSEWARPMNIGFNQPGACPQVTLEEMRVTEGAQLRTVVFTVKVTNDLPDRTCVLQRADMTLRDGDGHNYHYQGGDVMVANYGVKRARLTFMVPTSLEIVQLLVPDGRGGIHASDFELVQRQRY